MYTIGQVSELFDIPISTLRYYDREGLFPNMKRASGIRRFSEEDLELLRVIECLKLSRLEIREIRQFIQWIEEGSDTYARRKQLFQDRLAAVEEEMRRLEQARSLLRFKCWYYEQAMRDGDENRLSEIIPDRLPPDIRTLYDHGHEQKVPEV